MQGFFTTEQLSRTRPQDSLIAECGRCGLYKECRSPKMSVSGKGKRRILILGEAPGRDEDHQNRPFVGESGRYLRDKIRKIGFDMQQDCWIYNSLSCRPPNNATPTKKQINCCRPNVMRTIRELQPETIILLGATAVKSVIAPLWKEDPGKIAKWVGWQIPCQKWNAWICPTFHPSFLNRARESQPNYPVIEMFFERHLEQAFEKKGRPWENVPDFRSQVEIIYDARKAAKIIRRMRDEGGMIAFDYETDRLKPDSNESRIVSCSICWRGRRTIAYPWMGEAIRATEEILYSDCPKIASNGKFEDRWAHRAFGRFVSNFYWDTMLSAHILDNRKEITGLKFQAFVILGQEIYNKHIEPYLKAKAGKLSKSNSQNQIHRIELRDLLLYNGLDSLLEYHLAIEQMRKAKFPIPS